MYYKNILENIAPMDCKSAASKRTSKRRRVAGHKAECLSSYKLKEIMRPSKYEVLYKRKKEKKRKGKKTKRRRKRQFQSSMPRVT